MNAPDRQNVSQELNLQIQHRLMEELVASERRYRELVERIREVVFKCDEYGVISFLNRAWSDMLGYPLAQSLGRSIADFIFVEDRPQALVLFGKQLKDDAGEENYELRLVRCDGTTMWVMLSLRTGESVGKVGSLYNIDARKRAEAALQEVNEQLESRVQQRTAQLAASNHELAREVAERKSAQEELRQAFGKLKETQENLLRIERLAVVGETSGRVAHEILNPITSIFSRVENNIRLWQDFNEWMEIIEKITEQWTFEHRAGNLLNYFTLGSGESTCGDEDLQLLTTLAHDAHAFQQERKGDQEFVLKQLHRVIKIINTMRDSVRTQRTMVPIAISVPIGEAVDALADSLQKRRITIETNIPPQIPQVVADECEMTQIFTNLLRNATQSIEGKAQAGGLIQVQVAVNGQGLEVRIRDNGSGIPLAHQDSIFDFTFSTKTREQGTGLGLGISRRFARECGGDLVLEWSAEGAGTCFLITIPILQPSREAAHDC